MCSWLNQARRVRRVAECAMNRLEKLFAIKRFSQKSDYADLHRSDPRGAIFASCDHDHMGLRRYSAQPRQDFQAGHFFHPNVRSEEHTSELQSLTNLVCRLLLEKKKKTT